jgi:pimeloyl-ACP methyl ester carboxylesterase
VIFTWTDPASGAEELCVGFDRSRAARVLVLPAWFDEANKLRRFTLEVMRRLDAAGFDSLLPDLPGCNESLVSLVDQTLDGWREQALAAAAALGATHVLAIRAGALLAPAGLPGWHYAAQSGPKLLRGMIRARTIAAREAGAYETYEGLLTLGRNEGLVLGGWPLGAAMVAELESAEPVLAPGQSEIAQGSIGGPGLWLRAEPDDDAAQADRLAALIAENLAETAR